MAAIPAAAIARKLAPSVKKAARKAADKAAGDVMDRLTDAALRRAEKRGYIPKRKRRPRKDAGKKRS